MEKVFEVLGISFLREIDMSVYRDQNRKNLSYPAPTLSRRNGIGYYSTHKRINVSTFFQALFKKTRMAEMTYPIFVKLGLILWAVGLIENFNTWVGGVMSVLGAIGMGCYAYLTYQKARKLKIENDSAEFHLQMKKYGREKE